MQRAFAACGLAEAPIEALWEVYYAARNRVELYADALPALERITARWPVASLTNGNADLERIGIHTHFHCHVCARGFGVGKPDPRIFHAAAGALELMPQAVLHVGDDATLDALDRLPVPVVLVEREPRPRWTATPRPLEWVRSDHALGAADAVRHLHEHGRRRIGLVNGPEHTAPGGSRRQGYLDGLRACGLKRDDELVEVATDFTIDAGRFAADRGG